MANEKNVDWYLFVISGNKVKSYRKVGSNKEVKAYTMDLQAVTKDKEANLNNTLVVAPINDPESLLSLELSQTHQAVVEKLIKEGQVL